MLPWATNGELYWVLSWAEIFEYREQTFVKLPVRPGDFIFGCQAILFLFFRVHSSTTHFCHITKSRLESKIVFCSITKLIVTPRELSGDLEETYAGFFSCFNISIGNKANIHFCLWLIIFCLYFEKCSSNITSYKFLKQGLLLCSIINILILQTCFSVYCMPLAEEQVLLEESIFSPH